MSKLGQGLLKGLREACDDDDGTPWDGTVWYCPKDDVIIVANWLTIAGCELYKVTGWVYICRL